MLKSSPTLKAPILYSLGEIQTALHLEGQDMNPLTYSRLRAALETLILYLEDRELRLMAYQKEVEAKIIREKKQPPPRAREYNPDNVSGEWIEE